MRSEVRFAPAALVLTLVTLPLAAPRVASAGWPPFGRGIVTQPSSQTHSSIASDGAGGAIVTWQDGRSRRVNIFAQHVLATGAVDATWPLDGQPLLTDSLDLAGADGGQFAPLIVTDGAGGAIVAWRDFRSPVTGGDVFAQHLLATGSVDPDWKTDGTAVCTADGDQNNLAMIPDGAGGAIITWMDNRSGASVSDIFAQHLLASGAVDPLWPDNGLAVSTAPGLQEFPVIVEDGTGGAIIAWDDLRSSASGDDIYAQHVLGSGVADRGWGVNGRSLCTAPGDQARPTITTDGAHGAIVAWSDSRIVGTSHIFAQHVLGAGAIDPAWPLDGRAISNAGVSEARPLAVPDGAGGAIVTWQAFTSHVNTYAQHVRSTSIVDPAWPAGGRALSVTARNQVFADVAPDGAGGAVVAWADSFDVVAQHVLASGALDSAYPDSGRQICNLPSQQGDVAIVATGGGGAIVSWTDTRNGNADIFALQVEEAGTADVPPSAPPSVPLVLAGPNPASGPLTVRFTLPHDARVALGVFDLGGRRVRELATGVRGAGSHAVAWDLRDERGQAVAAGAYFVRLDSGGRSYAQKLMTLR